MHGQMHGSHSSFEHFGRQGGEGGERSLWKHRNQVSGHCSNPYSDTDTPVCYSEDSLTPSP